VLGGGHSWPGAPININITNMDFSASVEIWRFVSQFTLDGLITTTPEAPPQINDFTVYPNPTDGTINLQFEEDSYKMIIVTNHLGQAIEKRDCSCKRLQISLNQKGLYFISVMHHGIPSETKKVVVR
jgi:polyhydroxybutyrate depolymerase